MLLTIIAPDTGFLPVNIDDWLEKQKRSYSKVRPLLFFKHEIYGQYKKKQTNGMIKPEVFRAEDQQ